MSWQGLSTVVVGLVPIATLVVAVEEDRRAFFSRAARRRQSFDDAAKRVTVAVEWWNAHQALGEDGHSLEQARVAAQGWLREAGTLLADAGAPETPEMARRGVFASALLAYPMRRWSARLLRIGYYMLLMLVFVNAIVAVNLSEDAGWNLGFAILMAGLALGLRTWAAAIAGAAAAKDATAETSDIPNHAPVSVG